MGETKNANLRRSWSVRLALRVVIGLACKTAAAFQDTNLVFGIWYLVYHACSLSGRIIPLSTSAPYRELHLINIPHLASFVKLQLLSPAMKNSQFFAQNLR